jgi:biopolymer transport protein ExbD
MAGQISSDPNATISGINMTPLVDIMLVLLIIFLVTAKLTVTPPRSFPLDLPKSSTGEGTQLLLAIDMGKDGQMSVNGQLLPNDEALKPLAAIQHAAHPEVRAVIQADGKVLHERVIHVLDLLSQAGISQIAFGVTLTAAPK